jgi:hypothetical protein
MLHHPDIHRLTKLKLDSGQRHGSRLRNGFEHHSFLVFSRLGGFL